eukprot:TRINITY_DN23433_c0_g1_i1.p1 TRINITY_DN23433_c0_g1~~TRINITY_DN23433_c0_g1_i1.p1  ORF type:complete len:200 (+),score=33.40 TRINITY_DN23433_c0_g1_i1:112-711(+)
MASEGRCKIMSLKPENLRRAAVRSRWKSAEDEDATPPKISAEPEDDDLPFKPGQKVEVFGLTSDNGKLMNGKTGIVTKYLKDTGRFQLELGLANVMSLRPENLRCPGASTDWPESLPFKKGHTVEIFGLQSDEGKKMNGEIGIVVSYSSTKERFQVRVGDEVRNIKAPNLKRVDFSSAVKVGEVPDGHERSRSRSPPPH